MGEIRLNDVVPPPCGGGGGVAWDDGMYSGVRKIIVASGSWIDSIHVVYDKDGERVNANRHGGYGGNNNPEVILSYPNEFLVSVSGTYLNDLIYSLKFESNIREFGPFGTDVGTRFELTVEDGGQIVGMKGRSDLFLNAIGVHISRASKRKLVKEHESHGKLMLTGVEPPPYGGSSGVVWNDGLYNGVREIIVASGLHIDSIRVVYDKDGERVNADRHGGYGGNNNPEVILSYPNEFLVSVSGTYLNDLIYSLKFESNIREFGPFGTDVGTRFELTVEDGGQIVGMKGRSDLFLNAIGVHISRAPKRKLVKEHESHGKLRLTGVVPPPYGGHNGDVWDDGLYNGVREIIVASGVHINSIRVVYDKDGDRVNADKHGGDRGKNNPEVSLEYPDEFLVSVSGTYFKGLIHSLKFKSNKGEFGPFGSDIGTPFEFIVEEGGQIVGMKGRSGLYLDAIGVYISYAPERKLVKEHGKLRITGVSPPLYGGPNGGLWDDGMHSGVKEITVASGAHIDSICVVYDNDGERVNADKRGGDRGSTNPKVILKYPNEFLVSVSGTYFKGQICSLKFESNIRKFGPFGTGVGIKFELTVEDGGQIVGMKGRSGQFLNAIGVYISRAPKRKFVKHELHGKLRLTDVVPPPYEGPCGVGWDDGMYSDVKVIIVASGSWIDSIRVVYDKDNELVNGDKHEQRRIQDQKFIGANIW